MHVNPFRVIVCLALIVHFYAIVSLEFLLAHGPIEYE